MSNKLFKLPKEFTNKWLEALRSGNYQQNQKGLLFKDDAYCCLGVAGSILGIDNNQLENWAGTLPKIPEIPLDITGFGTNAKYLMFLNDGLSKDVLSYVAKRLYYNQDIIIRDREKFEKNYESGKVFNFNFNEIADFIEDNTETY